jgi:uncharacterized repeat protein (TIGR03803 family)
MTRRGFTSKLAYLLRTAVVVSLAHTCLAQYVQTVLHNFTYPNDAEEPKAGVIFDKAGNLYGTTYTGGDRGSPLCADHLNDASCGSVFELTPNSGNWIETLIYTFTGGNDGREVDAGVIFDAKGNLYGTTRKGGGNGNILCLGGCGTVFQLAPNSSGWTESLIHVFAGSPDGVLPVAGLVMDKTNDLYGTTTLGGTYGSGTVFTLVQGTSGLWSERILHNFTGGRDGGSPEAALIFDNSGNLYGTTTFGGTYGFGTVFQLQPVGNGGWKEHVLYDFSGGADGGRPVSRLILDQAGNLYGTTLIGGMTSACVFSSGFGCGTVFQLTLGSSGLWNENVLYAFLGGNDGSTPGVGVLLDSVGNLFGTTRGGGSTVACSGLGCGTVFKLTPSSVGWVETILHVFTGSSDGETPTGDLMMDNANNLYGTTLLSPSGSCCGTVYELSPTSNPIFPLLPFS